MPEPWVAKQGILATVGLSCAGNRFQSIVPFICEHPLDDPNRVADDIQAQLEILRTIWMACLASDCEFRGFQIEGLADSNVIPRRVAFAAGDYPGQVESESCPVNGSMLISFYNDSQIALAGRTRVAKRFIGPAPEENQAAGIINVAQFALNSDLALALGQPFNGDSTGWTWHMGLNTPGKISSGTTPPHMVNDPAGLIYAASRWSVRYEVFTQKRRMMPLF